MIKTLNQNKGFTLALSLIFLFLIVSFVSVYIMAASNGLMIAKLSSDQKRAFYLADAGLSDAFIQLRANLNPPVNFNVSNSNYSLGGSATGSYSVVASSDGAAFATYTLTSTGTYKGVSKTLILKVIQSSIATFAYLSNTEINPTLGALWWATGALTVGPTRTNGTLNIWGTPIFNGTVTETGASPNYMKNAVNNPNFVNGITNNAATVPFPTAALLNNISSLATSNGLLLTGSSTIVFNNDGTINVTNSAKGWNNKNMAMPANGNIYVQNSSSKASDGTATVSGTIKGQVTVGTASQTVISGNLVYNTDPRTNPSSTDILGLVSNNNITVQTSTAPANLEIDAVLVALNGAFQIDNPNVTGKGNMVQYGSLVNNYCGATSVADNSGKIVGGYGELQSYDTRLQTTIPPGFLRATDSTGRTIYVKISFKEQ